MLWYTDSIANLKSLYQNLKKEPPGSHIVLGGKVENQVFNHEQLSDLIDLPDLDTLRGQLVSIIGEPAQRVSRNIGHHPATLSRLLASHASPPEEETGGDASQAES